MDTIYSRDYSYSDMAIAISKDKQLLCDESERPDSKYLAQRFLNESGKRMALGARDLHCLCDPHHQLRFPCL